MSEFVKEYNRKVQEMQAELRPLFEEEFKRFFENVPEVEAIAWLQYTPYFNDGDACVFGVSGPAVIAADGAELDDLVEAIYDELNSFSKPGRYAHREEIDAYEAIKALHGEERVEEIGTEINRISTMLHGLPEEVLVGLFDNHVTVSATRNGFVVEEYCHD